MAYYELSYFQKKFWAFYFANEPQAFVQVEEEGKCELIESFECYIPEDFCVKYNHKSLIDMPLEFFEIENEAYKAMRETTLPLFQFDPSLELPIGHAVACLSHLSRQLLKINESVNKLLDAVTSSTPNYTRHAVSDIASRKEKIIENKFNFLMQFIFYTGFKGGLDRETVFTLIQPTLLDMTAHNMMKNELHKKIDHDPLHFIRLFSGNKLNKALGIFLQNYFYIKIIVPYYRQGNHSDDPIRWDEIEFFKNYSLLDWAIYLNQVDAITSLCANSQLIWHISGANKDNALQKAICFNRPEALAILLERIGKIDKEKLHSLLQAICDHAPNGPAYEVHNILINYVIKNPGIVSLSDLDNKPRSFMATFLRTLTTNCNTDRYLFHVDTLKLILRTDKLDLTSVLNEYYVSGDRYKSLTFFNAISYLLRQNHYSYIKNNLDTILEVIRLLFPFLSNTHKKELRLLPAKGECQKIGDLIERLSIPRVANGPERDNEDAAILYGKLRCYINGCAWTEITDMFLTATRDTSILLIHLQAMMDPKRGIQEYEDIIKYEHFLSVILSDELVDHIIKNRFQDMLLATILAKVHQCALSMNKKISSIRCLSNIHYLVNTICSTPDYLSALDTHLIRMEKLLNISIENTNVPTTFANPVAGLCLDLLSLVQRYLGKEMRYCHTK